LEFGNWRDDLEKAPEVHMEKFFQYSEEEGDK